MKGKLYLATVLDLSQPPAARLRHGEHHDAPLADAALRMAAATRGGNVDRA